MPGVADLLEGSEAWHVVAIKQKTVNARVNMPAKMVAGCAHVDAVPRLAPRHDAFLQLVNNPGGHFLKFIG